MMTRISLYLIDDRAFMPVDKRSSSGAYVMSDPVLESKAEAHALAVALRERLAFGNPKEEEIGKEVRERHYRAALRGIGVQSWKQLYARATYYVVDFKEDVITVQPTGSSPKEGFFPIQERKTVWIASTSLDEIAQWVIDDFESR